MRRYVTLLILIILGTIKPLAAQNYAPNDTTYDYKLVGTVYAKYFEGKRTASGEIFRHKLYTAAHWKIKLGTLVLVTCPETGKQIIVKVNDRCPKKGILDLTRKAAADLGIKGTKKVILRQLPDSYLPQWKSQTSSKDIGAAIFDTDEKDFAVGNVYSAINNSSKVEMLDVALPPDDQDEPQY